MGSAPPPPSMAWPFVGAEDGPPPLPAPVSASASAKSLGVQRKQQPPVTPQLEHYAGASTSKQTPTLQATEEADSADAGAGPRSNWSLAPVFTPPSPRWAPETRKGWLGLAAAAEHTPAAPPSVIGAAAATPELVLERLARDGAVVVTGLAPPAVCAAVNTARGNTMPQRPDGCLALASAASHELLAHPLVMSVCNAVLACQALRMPEEELCDRMVLSGSFTSQRPLQQLAWELDYARCDGAVHSAPNLPPAVPSLLGLEQQLTAVWQLSDDDGEAATAGTLLSAEGEGVPVTLGGVGTVLLALGGGPGRWAQGRGSSQLQAVGYQLGILQPAQNHYLLAAAVGSSSSHATWFKAVDELPMHIQRLLGFHMPGQVLNKVYAAPGPPDILRGLGALAGAPINWAHSASASTDKKGQPEPPAVSDPENEMYVPVKQRTEEVAAVAAAAVTIPEAGSVSGLVACEPELERFFESYVPAPPPSPALLADPKYGGGVTAVEWPGDGAAGVGLVAVVKQMIEALDRDGAVVLSGAVSPAVCGRIEAEIAPYCWQARGISATTGGPVGSDYSTGTCGSLLARSVAVQAMAAHPAVVAATEGVLGRQVLHPSLAKTLSTAAAPAASGNHGRLGWRVHVDLTIPKDPGSGRQQLHRDGDLSLWDCDNECSHAVSVIWALDGDFTNARGTTRIVLGSRHWPRGRVAVDAESVGAEMKRGSALLYVGRTYHGAGENSTDATRIALNIAYNSSFLKQECNTFVTCTPFVARQMKLPSLVAELVGYAGAEAEHLFLGIEEEEVAAAAAAVSKL